MATTDTQGFNIAGIGVGGLMVIAGLFLLLIVSGWNLTGIVLILVGLVAFGGFAKGKWY